MFSLKKLICNSKNAVLAQYLVLLDAAKSQKSSRRSNTTVISPQASKERAFQIYMLVESVCIVVQNAFLERALTPALFLICL